MPLSSPDLITVIHSSLVSIQTFSLLLLLLCISQTVSI